MRVRVAAASLLMATAVATPARGFMPAGHDAIEAIAYKRLVARARVPGTEVSGRQLLEALFADSLLAAPPCWQPHSRGVSCDERARQQVPLVLWPPTLSGALDMIISRQIDQHGQCQHFMAETVDGLSPIPPGQTVPSGLVNVAYRRCVRVLAGVLQRVVQDPAGAEHQGLGMYALMHAVADGFSAAHVSRQADGRIAHLKSWTLIDWPRYFLRGRFSFPSATHHAIKDDRDEEYLQADGRAVDGRPCQSFGHPYSVPEECLTPLALRAVAAVEDLLILAHRLHRRTEQPHTAASRLALEDAPEWKSYVETHFAGPVSADLRPPEMSGRVMPNILLGLRGSPPIRRDDWSVGLSLARMAPRRALVPFLGRATAVLGYGRDRGVEQLFAGGELALLTPVLAQLALGGTPLSGQVACQPWLHDCDGDARATVVQAMIAPPHAHWWAELGGPSWSWLDRAWRGPRLSVSVGWNWDPVPKLRRRYPPPDGWSPPDLEAGPYRTTRHSWQIFLASSAGATETQSLLGGGIEVRRDRDQWDRRSGWVPGLRLDVAGGTVEGNDGAVLGLAATVRYYLVPGVLALVASPAVFTLGPQSGSHVAPDLAGRIGVAFAFGSIELSLDSPSLSYLSRDRWHARPLSARLGFFVD